MSTYRLISLGVFLFAVYLLTYTPRINSSDGLAMFATAESLIRRGAVDVEQIRWMGLQQGTFGLDGLLYSRKGIGVPVAMLPLTWLGFMVSSFGMVTTSLLFNVIVTVLTAILLAHYLARLGYNESVGLLVALTFGLGTLAWPYAKSLFSDPFSGLLLLVTAYSLWQYHQTKHSIWLFGAGVALAWNIATRYAEIIFVPIFGLYLLYYLKPYKFQNPIRLLGLLSLFGLPIGIILLAIAIFNFSRYGDPFNTGYLPNETFSGVWLQGIIGQLISPGRGLLLYSPIFSLTIIGAWRSWQRQRAETLLAGTIILLHLLLYGKWFMWHGGYAWGPRFLIPTLPFWCILLAPVAQQALNYSETQSVKPTRFTWLYLILFTLSFIPQCLSVTIDFAPFQDSLMTDGLPLFDPATFFEWRYSPFVGAWAFIQANSLDVAWAWQGHIAWGLLALLSINGLLGAINLIMVYRHNSRVSLAITILFSLISVTILLQHAHNLPTVTMQQNVSKLNQFSQPDEAIILNDPDLTMPFAELYKGQAMVLGLSQGGFPLPQEIDSRLQQVMATHEQIWWLPNWLPPSESAIEQTLLAQGVLLRSEEMAGQRLTLWSIPRHLSKQILPPETQFDTGITLQQVVYSDHVQAGRGFVIELQWQTSQIITDDYHVFIHLINQAGEVVAQTDGQPVHWTRPTSGWGVSETITDRYGLWLAPDRPKGNYQLRLGWYQPSNGQRLLLPSGADAVVFTVNVE